MVPKANLRPFVRPELDVLFVALNPPMQSNARRHYFSGDQSRFFHLLARSGLTTQDVPKHNADEVVFGSTQFNVRGASFGIADLVPDVVQTDSSSVRPGRHHVEALLGIVRRFEPRFTCIIHSKVSHALRRFAKLSGPLEYGSCGTVIPGSNTHVFLNYFPNGNSIPDEPKLMIFRALARML